MVDTSPTVTSEQEICDLLHDATVVCDMVSVVTDLSIPKLLCQIVAEIMGTVQVQDGLGLIRGRGNQNFVTHWVCLNCSHYRHGVGRSATWSGQFTNWHRRLRFSIRKSIENRLFASLCDHEAV